MEQAKILWYDGDRHEKIWWKTRSWLFSGTARPMSYTSFVSQFLGLSPLSGSKPSEALAFKFCQISL